MPYKEVPPFAWSGWRLSIPGGPVGGQYHGFIGPDSSASGWTPPGGTPAPANPPSPWDHIWGGVALKEGENRSDYVYRSSAEMRPRANASGGANVISAFQTRKTAGYAEAPGNYKGLGAMVQIPSFYGNGGGYEAMDVPAAPGATSTVAQPPAPGGNPGGTLVNYSVPPVSPSPSPTVAAPANAYLPANQTQPAAAAVPTGSISEWLTSSTIISGVENMWVAGAAALAAYFLLKGRG
jgi:hypothetical protein